MRAFVSILSLVLVAGCVATSTPSSPSSPSPSTAVSASPAASAATVASASASPIDPVAEDLAYLDAQVRAHHPDPFAIHPESE